MWSNWETESPSDFVAVLSGQNGMWNSKPSNQQFGYICKKMRKFSNCVATVKFERCGHSGTNERECHDLGCCWDSSKERSCFYSGDDTRSMSEQPTTHGPGFAAGMTALTFVLIYAAAGVGYFVYFR